MHTMHHAPYHALGHRSPTQKVHNFQVKIAGMYCLYLRMRGCQVILQVHFKNHAHPSVFNIATLLSCGGDARKLQYTRLREDTSSTK